MTEAFENLELIAAIAAYADSLEKTANRCAAMAEILQGSADTTAENLRPFDDHPEVSEFIVQSREMRRAIEHAATCCARAANPLYRLSQKIKADRLENH